MSDATIQVKLLRETARLPERMSDGASGWDVFADLPAPLIVHAGTHTTIPLGIALEVPPGWEAQLRPRSGLAAKASVLGHFGTIDADFRGEVHAILFNLAVRPLTVKPGDRVGQLVFARVPGVTLVQADTLGDTPRAAQGFGSTGR